MSIDLGLHQSGMEFADLSWELMLNTGRFHSLSGTFLAGNLLVLI
jgi:hypothetical protein